MNHPPRTSSQSTPVPHPRRRSSTRHPPPDRTAITQLIGYARLSPDEEARSGISTSITIQATKIRSYCELRDLPAPIGIIEDPCHSGKDLERPGIITALEFLRENPGSCLVVAKLDRLTRSVLDFGKLMEEFFGEGAQYPSLLMSAYEQIDLRTAGGRFTLSMMALMSQWEREVISERTRAGLAHLKAQGVKLGRPIHLLSPEDVGMINRIRSMQSEGMSMSGIARVFNTLAISTPSRNPDARWHQSTVAMMLGREGRGLADLSEDPD